jgi:hypothetical protein
MRDEVRREYLAKYTGDRKYEMLMRDYGYQLIEPAYDRQRWYSVLGEWGMTHYFKPEWYHCDITAYAARLMNAYVRSETSRYSRLDEDVRNDVVRIEHFVPVARRVLDIDGKRDKSLGFVPVLSGQEVANAKARIGENYLVVAWVQQALLDRAASYRLALERLIIVAPSLRGRDRALAQSPADADHRGRAGAAGQSRHRGCRTVPPRAAPSSQVAR